MKKKKWHRISLLASLLIVLIIALIIGFPYIKNHLTEKEVSNQETDILGEVAEEDEANQEVIPAPAPTSQTSEAEFLEEVQEPEPEPPITDEKVKVKDIYITEGGSAEFQCYSPIANTIYLWEIYNLDTKAWEDADTMGEILLQTDELNRPISILRLPAKKEYHNLNVRCSIQNTEEDLEVQKGKLIILDSEIAAIKMTDTYKAAAGEYISSLDIPVEVTFIDNTVQTITGLQGLFFCTPKDKAIDVKRNQQDGNTIETVTTKTIECKYLYVEAAKQEVLLRYRTDKASLDIQGIVEGMDEAAPEIYGVKISPYEVTNDDARELVLTVEIDAEDNFTPYPALQYAFLPAGKEITQEDWQNESTFETIITQNGEWIAYCQDEMGNYATSHKEIIAVDQKAPIIKSVLLESVGWCKVNTIIVDAEDKTAMQYCFSNGITDSEWITYNEYVIEDNGIWIIKVKDEAGNVSEAEIEVSNIDKISPTIQRIDEIEEIGGDQ